MGQPDLPLGDRMKLYELHHTNQVLLQGAPVLARMDGRAFHSYTKGMERPYDASLSEAMVHTTMDLVEETNALVGYTQSDEISLLWLDNVYFGGKVHKMLSHLAAQTTLSFYKNHGFRYSGRRPTFDARVWVVPSKREAANYFVWREKDAIKNSISMAAHCYYSDTELHQKNSDERQELLFQKGVNWNAYPKHFKRGTFVRREEFKRRLSPEELQDLPPLHHARKNPDMRVKRSEIREVSFAGIIKTSNRQEFLFDGAAPVKRIEDNG
jgi:tRNA(His) guanylyltransferase